MKYRHLLASVYCLAVSALSLPSKDQNFKRQTTGNISLPLTPAEILQQVQIENQIQDATQQIIELQKQLLTIGNASTNGSSESTSLGGLANLPIQCNCNCGGTNNNGSSNGNTSNLPTCIPLGNSVVNPSFEFLGGSLTDWIISPPSSVITDTVNYVTDGLGRHSALISIGANGTGGGISQVVNNLCPNTSYIFSFLGEPQIPDLIGAAGTISNALTVPPECDVIYSVGNLSLSTPVNNLTSNVGSNPLTALGGKFTPIQLNFTTGLNQTSVNISIGASCPGGLTSLIGQPSNVTLGINVDDVAVSAA